LIQSTNPSSPKSYPSQYRQKADQSIGSVSILEIFKRTTKRYAKPNGIKLPTKDCDAILFSFLHEVKFIDFAHDECDIRLSMEIFKTHTKDD
jgi:hypothetical protein